MGFKEDATLAAGVLAAYLDRTSAGAGPVLEQPPLAALAASLELEPLIARGGLHGERLAAWLGRYLDATTRLHHPGYYAHQVAAPEPAGAVASLVDSLTNNQAAIYEMGPGAATIEFVLVSWLLGKVGWPAPPLPPAAPSPGCAGGVLTHGGSLANLTALLAARARVDPAAWAEGSRRDLVVVAPEAAHYSISRAVGIMGLGQRALVAAPCDADGRLQPDRLAATLAAQAAAGKTVLAVVANACSTAVGLYDPLREAALACRERGAWLHVDGAHGASALVSPSLRHLLDGVALADSLVWDAHKMLRVPGLCAAVLVRDARHLDGTFRQDASYLFHAKDEPGYDFMPRTVECTKGGLGLRLFLVLASRGEAALAAHVERQAALGTLAAARLAREPGLEVAVAPESNIVCFRVAGDDDHQLAVRRRLLAAGRHYVSSTAFRGRRWLRLSLMSPATDEAEVERLAAAVRRASDEVRAAPRA